eukprot:745639-Hanusia_phi.AAC.1
MTLSLDAHHAAVCSEKRGSEDLGLQVHHGLCRVMYLSSSRACSDSSSAGAQGSFMESLRTMPGCLQRQGTKIPMLPKENKAQGFLADPGLKDVFQETCDDSANLVWSQAWRSLPGLYLVLLSLFLVSSLFSCSQKGARTYRHAARLLKAGHVARSKLHSTPPPRVVASF